MTQFCGDGGAYRQGLIRTVTLSWIGDSWSAGVSSSGDIDGPRRYLEALLQADLASGVITGGPALLRWVGFVNRGTAPTNNVSSVAGSKCVDYISGNVGLSIPAISAEYGPGNPITAVDVFIECLGHNDSLADFESPTLGKTKVASELFAAIPTAIVVSVSNMWIPVAGDSFNDWMTSTGWPTIAATGQLYEPCDNPGASFVSATDIDPVTGHPNHAGNVKLANGLRAAVGRAISRVLAA